MIFWGEKKMKCAICGKEISEKNMEIVTADNQHICKKCNEMIRNIKGKNAISVRLDEGQKIRDDYYHAGKGNWKKIANVFAWVYFVLGTLAVVLCALILKMPTILVAIFGVVLMFCIFEFIIEIAWNIEKICNNTNEQRIYLKQLLEKQNQDNE